jgi:hypothetical protein
MSGIYEFSFSPVQKIARVWRILSNSIILSSFENFQSYTQTYLQVWDRFDLIPQDTLQNPVVYDENTFQAMKQEAEAHFSGDTSKVAKVELKIARTLQDKLFDFSLQTAQDPRPQRQWTLHRDTAQMSSLKALQAYLEAEMKSTNEIYHLIVHTGAHSSDKMKTTLFVSDEHGFGKMLDLAVEHWIVHPDVHFKVIVIAQPCPVFRCALCDDLKQEVPEEHYESCRTRWIQVSEKNYKYESSDSYYVPGARVFVHREFDRKPVVDKGFIVRKAPGDTFCVKLRTGQLLSSVLRQSLTREDYDICKVCDGAIVSSLPFSAHYECCRLRTIDKANMISFPMMYPEPFFVGTRVLNARVLHPTDGEGFIVKLIKDLDYFNHYQIQLSNGVLWNNVPKEDLVLALLEKCKTCEVSFTRPFTTHYENCRLRVIEKWPHGFQRADGFNVGSRIFIKLINEEGFIVKPSNDMVDDFVVQLQKGVRMENISKHQMDLKFENAEKKDPTVMICIHCAKVGLMCTICKSVLKYVCEAKECQDKHYDHCRSDCIAVSAEKKQIQSDALKIGSTVWMQKSKDEEEGYVCGFIVSYDEVLAEFSVKFRGEGSRVRSKIKVQDLLTDYRPVKEIDSLLFESRSRHLSVKAITIFKRVFMQYSCDGIVKYYENEMTVHKRARFMNLEQFGSFIQDLSQGRIEPAKLVVNMYYKNASAVSIHNTAALLEQEFVDYYMRIAANGNTEWSVWYDLFRLGYDANLDPVPDDKLFGVGTLVEFFYNKWEPAVVLEVRPLNTVDILILDGGKRLTCARSKVRTNYYLCKKCQLPLENVSVHSFPCCELCESPRSDCSPVQYIALHPPQ